MSKKGLLAVAIVAVLVIASLAVAIMYMNDKRKDDGASSDSKFYIVDDRGKNITFASSPQRIVSLGSSFTDIIVSLGGKDKIVGVDSSSTSMTNVSGVENLGKPSALSIESLVELSPDCVIIWNFSSYQTVITNMESNNISVVALYPKTVSDAMNTMDRIGKMIGSNATSTVSALQARMNAVVEKTKTLTSEQRTSIYLELASYGGQTVGNGTLSNELITMAGGTNIFANGTGNFLASKEWIVADDPSIIVIENSSTKTNQQLASTLGSSVSAVQNNKIYRIDAGTLTISPRMVDALEDLASWLHPDLFPPA